MATRKFNPGFLSDDELVASFCVRTSEFESMIDLLRDCDGSAGVHQIVIGPRGCGKTSLLLRIAVELRRDSSLSSRYFPVVFAEESYEVATAGEFWLECLGRLADQAPCREGEPDLRRTHGELRRIRDDRVLGDRCLGALQDFADREGRRLVLIVENLGMMFAEMTDSEAGWRLRQILQTEPRILLLASATSRFDAINNPKCALYEQFRVVSLRPLDADDCASLWRATTGQQRAPEAVKTLRILTGGNLRWIAIMARFGSQGSFRELIEDLLDLVNDHTEYFKSHLEALAPQERRVYLSLADLWKPATTREIADRARLDTSKCSAHLARLAERGVVEVAGGSARRKLYYVVERLYNIYYLMRRSSCPAPLVEALVHFMEAYYSPSELKDLGASAALEAEVLDARTEMIFRAAFAKLIELPTLAAHREELYSLMRWVSTERVEEHAAMPAEATAAKALVEKAVALGKKGRAQEALVVLNKVVRRYGESEALADQEQVGKALVNKGVAYAKLNQHEDALDAWEEVVERFGAKDAPRLLSAAAIALTFRGNMLRDLDRPDEALAAWNEVMRRFGGSKSDALADIVLASVASAGTLLLEINEAGEALSVCDEAIKQFGSSNAPAVRRQVAVALFGKGTALAKLQRMEEALAVWEEVVQRFGDINSPLIREVIASSLFNKSCELAELNRLEEAIADWDTVLQRFGTDKEPALEEAVRISLFNKGIALIRLQRLEEAVDACDEFVQRFEAKTAPEAPLQIAKALANKEAALAELGQFEDAVKTCDELVRRFGASNAPEILQQVAEALFNKGIRLVEVNRLEVAAAAWKEVAQRFGESDTLMLREMVAVSLVNMGNVLNWLDRLEEALAAWAEVVQHFGESEEPNLLGAVSQAMVGTGGALVKLNRLEEALAVCDNVVQRFGANDGRALHHQQVARALVCKGIALGGLQRVEGATAVWDEVVRRFGECDTSALRSAAGFALVKRAEIELARGEAKAAIESASRAFDRIGAGSPEKRLPCHLIQAQASLEDGDIATCTENVIAVLELLPELKALPKRVLDALLGLAIDLGLARTRDLIQASPAANLLVPLTTALDRELGLEPRVAKEIEEVAEDIQRDMEKLRRQQRQV